MLLLKKNLRNYVDPMKFFIQKGGNIDAKDLTGKTPLCSSCNLPTPIFRNLKRLVEMKAQINVQTREGLTPLHLASMNGNSNIVKYLLEKNANPDLLCESKETPLHKIAIKGDSKTAEFLLNACPNSFDQKKYGW